MTRSYKPYPLYKSLALAFALFALAAVWNESKAQHEHEAPAPSAKLVLDNGKKWPTDAPLRQGMTQIRDSLQATLPAIHAGKLDNAGYQRLAGKVNADIGHIVQNCKLEPDADAMLHLVLADVISGAEIMEGKQAGTAREQGAIRIVAALNNYGAYFDHPNWKAPTH
jgi:hypothetical protein